MLALRATDITPRGGYLPSYVVGREKRWDREGDREAAVAFKFTDFDCTYILNTWRSEWPLGTRLAVTIKFKGVKQITKCQALKAAAISGRTSVYIGKTSKKSPG